MGQLQGQGGEGFVWVDQWRQKYQDALGTQQQFLESRPDKFTVIYGQGRKYSVALAGKAGHRKGGSSKGEADQQEADPEEADPEEVDPEIADVADPDEADPVEADPEEADPEEADPAETLVAFLSDTV